MTTALEKGDSKKPNRDGGFRAWIVGAVLISVGILGVTVLKHFLGYPIGGESWPIAVQIVGWVALAIGVLFGVLNGYLSYGRWYLHKMKGGDANSFKFVSGLPGIGTAAIAVGSVLTPVSVVAGITALFTLVVDAGGAPWLVYSMYKQQ
jgi:hypothetical protein